MFSIRGLGSSKLETFVEGERGHYTDNGNNRFSLALGQAVRYESFLRMILERHVETTMRFRAAANVFQAYAENQVQAEMVTDPDVLSALGEMRFTTHYIQLDSESFYLFAKILLDRIANFLEEYFRPLHTQARGYSFRSHDAMTKKFAAFAAAQLLELPPSLQPLLVELKEKVSDYRDYQISHDSRMQIAHMTTWSRSDFVPRIVKSPVFTTDWQAGKKAVESAALEELMALVDRYLEAVCVLIARNRQHSSFLRELTRDGPKAP